MSEHTPGPWTHRTPADGSRGRIYADNFHVANTFGNEANARLIAAAPETAAERDRLRALNAELLEALEVALYALRRATWDDEAADFHLCFHADDLVCTAIAKAKGQEVTQ